MEFGERKPGLVRRVEGLTSLRGIAAFWVMLYHYAEFMPDGWRRNLDGMSGIVGHGYLAVDFFFILSGFIIAHVHMEDFAAGPELARITRFMKLRFARIYPLHLVTLMALVCLDLVWETLRWNSGGDFGWMPWQGRYSVVELVRNVLLLQGGFAPIHSWNFPSWSIGAEWFAYLTFPFVAWACVSRMPRLLIPAAGILAIFWLDRHFGTLNVGSGFFYPLLKCLGEFWIGVGIFLVARRWTAPLPVSRAAVAIILGLMILAAHASLPDMFFVGLSAALVTMLASAPSVAASWLNGPYLDALGERSYSLYMVHALVSFGAERFFVLCVGPLSLAPDMARAGLFVAMILVSMAMADVLHRRVEVPARAWLRPRS